MCEKCPQHLYLGACTSRNPTLTTANTQHWPRLDTNDCDKQPNLCWEEGRVMNAKYRLTTHAMSSNHSSIHRIQCQQHHSSNGHHCITISWNVQLNANEISKIRTCSVSAKLEDPGSLFTNASRTYDTIAVVRCPSQLRYDLFTKRVANSRPNRIVRTIRSFC